ncbi:MAG: hypothetical protein ACKVPX_14035 [Myxococcaceae bacterium]
MNCETFSAEISTGFVGLSSPYAPFASFAFQHRRHEWSTMLGVKGSVGAGPLASGTLKAGFYVQGRGWNEIKDVGVRGEASVSIGGNISVAGPQVELEFGFVALDRALSGWMGQK